MLFNFDHATYALEEYERRLAAFRLERKLRKRQREATQVNVGLGMRWLQQVSRLAMMRWNHAGGGPTAHKPAQRWQTLPSGK